MYINYLKTGWRNILRNKLYSLVNISGLAIGLSVAILIGIWVCDELSFDKNHTRYDRIGQLWQFVSFGPQKSSYISKPVPMAIVALLAIVITLITVSFQALKAALSSFKKS